MEVLLICLGGGYELLPITSHIPKELIPIGNKPLIFHTIELLIESGISHIIILTSNNKKEILKRSISDYFNRDFEYITIEDANHLLNGILKAEDYISEERFLVVLGDNSFNLDFASLIGDFKSNCRIYLKEVENPEDFTVAYIGDNKVINIVKKPKVSFSNYAISGIFSFDKSIFQACKDLKSSLFKINEMPHFIKWLLENDYYVGYKVIQGYWSDLKSSISLIEENLHRLTYIEDSIKGEVVNSKIGGRIVLGRGAVLYNSIIRGPIIIGRDAEIKNSYIGPYTSIGEGVKIYNSSVENSIILNNCIITGVDHLIDSSYLGEGTIIGTEDNIRKTSRLILGNNNRIYLK